MSSRGTTIGTTMSFHEGCLNTVMQTPTMKQTHTYTLNTVVVYTKMALLLKWFCQVGLYYLKLFC